MFLHPGIYRLLGILRKLILPSSLIQDDEQRHRARLLAGLSLSLIWVSTIVLIIWIGINPEYPAAPFLSIVIITTLVGVYLLSRTRYYHLGALLLCIFSILTIVSIVLTAPDPLYERLFALNFLVITILLASILLPIGLAMVIIGVSLVIAAVFLFVPDAPFQVTFSFVVFIVIMSALIVMASLMQASYLSRRKQAEESLQASEERFRQLTYQAPDTIYILNLITNDLVFINRDDFLGYSLEELRSPGSITKHVHPDDLPEVIEFWKNLVSGSKTQIHVVDYRIRHKAGHMEWIHNRATVLSFSPEGKPCEVLVVATLITDAKRKEETLRQQEEYLRVLIEQTPIGIMTVNMAGIITDANPRSLEILKAPNSSAVINLNIVERPPFVNNDSSPTLEKAFSDGIDIEIENWYTSLWGKLAYLQIRAVPHFDAQNNQIGLIVLLEDLTQRIEAVEAMRQMQKMESLSVLSGGIAHDFNNLLVAMLGQSSLALTKLPPDNPVTSHVAKVVTAAEKASHLTQQLLAYSGHSQYQIGLLDLNELIEENRHLFAATIPKNIQLKTKLAPTLPLVEVDFAQIQQVVMNMIINAAEALGEANGTIFIVSSSQIMEPVDNKSWQFTAEPIVTGRYVILEIHDNGPGIPKEILPSIFDPFFTTKERGHGLGLAAVLGIIKAHRGALSVFSEKGIGTTFKILLPASMKKRQHIELLGAAEKPLLTGCVLIIDDEEHVREAVIDILVVWGVKVLAAHNGETGLNIYKDNQADIALVILDLSMPGWSGEKTMTELRKVKSDLTIILSSGYDEKEATRRFSGEESIGFLQKPYTAEKLVEIVRKHLAN